jgi:hypothetical protein
MEASAMDNFKERADEAQQRLARALAFFARAKLAGRGLKRTKAFLKRAQTDADAIIAEARKRNRQDANRPPWYTDGQYA